MSVTDKRGVNGTMRIVPFIMCMFGFTMQSSLAFAGRKTHHYLLGSSSITTSFSSISSNKEKANGFNHQCNVLTRIRGGAGEGTSPVSSSRLQMIIPSIDPKIANFIAGSIAGAIGVGVAFPFDTLKTKSQVLGDQMKKKKAPLSTSSSDSSSTEMDPSQLNMLRLFAYIYQQEGLSGFYGGVRGMMIGQAIIKSVAFAANGNALMFLNSSGSTRLDDILKTFSFGMSQEVYNLVLAACFAGFVTSFLVTPIERVKLMMQADSKGGDGEGEKLYKNELDCIKAILRSEGWVGFMNRGLAPTIIREVPSYMIYFVIYGILMKQFANYIGPHVAPLIMGAIAGCACWIPVYPVDVVKTLVQNTEGGSDGEAKRSSIEVTKQLYAEGGIMAFFDGLTPKMIRAAINHSVTFYVFELVNTFLVTGVV